MSLPTQAWYYDKNDVVIHKEYVNVGWYLTWDNWLEVVNSLPVIEGAIFIKVYCVKFPVSWINSKSKYLFELYNDRQHNNKDIDGWRYFRKVYGSNWYKKYLQQSNSEIDAKWDALRLQLSTDYLNWFNSIKKGV